MMRFSRYRLLAHPCSLAVFICLAALTTACESPPKTPDFGDHQRFYEDAVVGRVIEQRLEQTTLRPDHADAWVDLGIAFEANDFINAAVQSYDHALTLKPDHAKAWYRLGVAYTSLGESQAAFDAFDASLAADPDYAATYWRRGYTRMDLGDFEAAADDFRRAIESDDAQFPAILGLARTLLNKNQPAAAQQAVDLLVPLTERHPRLRQARNLLGLAYRQLGRLEEARGHLEAGARGANSGPLTQKSLVFSRYVRDPWQRELKEARASHRIFLQRARQAFMAGDLEGAVTLLEELRQHRPDDVTLGLNLASVYRQGERGEDAIALLRELLADHPQRFHVAMDLAWNLYENDQTEAALEMAERAAAIDPRATGPARLRDTVDGVLPPPALAAPGDAGSQPILIQVQKTP